MLNEKEFDVRQKRVHIAAKMAYVFLGVGVGTWGTLIPYVKDNLNIQEGVLGLLILCRAAGAILSMPFSGVLASRFGCRRVLALSVPALLLSLVSLSIIDNIWLFALALAFFGVNVGIIDVVMNIQAVFIEKAHDKSMMSGLHGMYSVGALFGAGLMAGMLTAGLSPTVSCIILAGSGCILLFAFCLKYFLPYGDMGGKKTKSSFTIPKGLILILGILSFMLYMNEGVVLDWSALFLIQERGFVPAHAVVGYAIFSGTTAIGRLLGDSVVNRLGVKKVLIGGGFVSAMGYVVLLSSNSFALAIVGFSLVGFGAANMIPQLFSLSGRQKAIPLHVAIATVATIGFSGLLVGPVFMGFVAELTGLSTVFGIMAVLLLIVGIISIRIRIN